MNKDDKKIRILEDEIREIQNKGRFALFLEKYGYQLLVQTLSIVIAATLFYAATTNSIEKIKENTIATAAALADINNNGTIPNKILKEKINSIVEDIQDIKATQIRICDKLNIVE